MMTHPDALLASDYVVCATLRKISDLFNVDLLWAPVRGGRQEGTFLLDALRRYPRTPRTRQHHETYYSQVLVRIPERDYVRDDRLEEGQGRRTLIRDLLRLHEQELGKLLAEDAKIRYRVEPDATLRPGEVQFLFGRAIYVPAEGETAMFRIEAAADGRDEWRDLGPVYTGQRLTLLNSDRRTSSFAVLAWPFIGGESVLLVMRAGPSVDVVAEPPGCLSLTDDGAGGFVARDRRNRGIRLRVTAPVGHGKFPAMHESSLESIPPVLLSASEEDPVVASAGPPERAAESSLISPNEYFSPLDPWGRREPMLGAFADFDISSLPPGPNPMMARPAPIKAVPLPPQVVGEVGIRLESSAPDRAAPVSAAPEQATPALPALERVAPASAAPASPQANQQTWIPQRPAAGLRVIGVALQRLSTYASAGISDWRLSFSRAGNLVLDAHPEAAAWLRIDSSDRIFGEATGSSIPMDLPGTWHPFPGLKLEFDTVPPPMAGHYLGWMHLPTPLELPISRGRVVSFGRGTEADIAPQLLADPRSLRWEGSLAKTVGISAEYLGLSRRHLSLQVRQDDWWVQLESQNMPVYRLSPSGELLDVLTPGVNTATEARPGDLLVAGGYVLALGVVG